MNKTILIIITIIITKTALFGNRCVDLIYPLCELAETSSLQTPQQKKGTFNCYCDEVVQQPAYGTVSCEIGGNIDGLYQYDIADICAREDTFTVIECCILTGPVCDTIQYMVHISSNCEIPPPDKFCCVPNDGNPLLWDVLANDVSFLQQNYPTYTQQILEIQGITTPPLFGTANIIQSFSIEYTVGQTGFIGIDSVGYDVLYELIDPQTNDTITICAEQTAYFLIEDCLDMDRDEFTLAAGDTLYFGPLANDSIIPTLTDWCPDSLACLNPLPQIVPSSLVLLDTGSVEIVIGPVNQIWCFTTPEGGEFAYTYEVCTSDNLCNTDTINIYVAENCDSTLNIIGETLGGTYQAGTLLASTGTVADNTDVDFKAGTTIFLDAGFSVPIGSDFSAEIEACDCTATDQLALEALYHATNGSDWTNTWDLTQPLSTWYGVTLDTNGCVSELDLSSNNLVGNIPAELGNLSQLIELGLHNNSLSGNIPAALGNLTAMLRIYLFDNQLSGNIPDELGDLTELRYLRMSNNQLTGNIPTELGNLSKLTHLLLYDNDLTGSIPNTLTGLSDLIFLRVYNNQLSGCYDAALLSLCSQLDAASNTNSSISNGNSFDANWESFCSSGAGTCP